MQKTNFKYEILIHDDASTDRTAAIIREYETKFPGLIKPIYQTENQYSKGVKVELLNSQRARGKYVALCEGDDYWVDPLKLQKQVDYMERRPKCSMCFHAAKITDARDAVCIGSIRPYNRTCVLSYKRLFFGGGHFAPTASILYKKALLDDLPSFYFKSPVGDHAIAVLLFSRGRIGYIDEFMSTRRLWVPESWNTRWHNNTKDSEKVKHLQKLIDFLLGFNEYTKGKWESDVYKMVLEWTIQSLTLQGYSDPLNNPTSKQIIKRLGFYDKLRIFFMIKTPNFHANLGRIKGKLTGVVLAVLNAGVEIEDSSRLKN